MASSPAACASFTSCVVSPVSRRAILATTKPFASKMHTPVSMMKSTTPIE